MNNEHHTIVRDFKAGNQLFREGKLAEAVAAYGRAIAQYPHFYWSYYNLGEVLAELGRLDEAGEAFTVAIALFPSSPWSYEGLGQVRSRQGQKEAAVAAYHRALELKPDWLPFYHYLGEAQVAAARREEASKTYQRQGMLLAERGWLGKAIVAYRQALEMNPNEAEIYQALGNACTIKGSLLKQVCVIKRL